MLIQRKLKVVVFFSKDIFKIIYNIKYSLDLKDECIKKFWSLNLDEPNKAKNEAKKQMIFSQVKDCVGELFKCFEHEPTVFQPLNNGFELYGLDFLVDENLG